MSEINTAGLFNTAESMRLKEQGINRAANNRLLDLERARNVARLISTNNPFSEVTADDVQAIIIGEGINLGNAAGSIFRGKDWKFVRYEKSKRITNHARVIRVWKWTP